MEGAENDHNTKSIELVVKINLTSGHFKKDGDKIEIDVTTIKLEDIVMSIVDNNINVLSTDPEFGKKIVTILNLREAFGGGLKNNRTLKRKSKKRKH